MNPPPVKLALHRIEIPFRVTFRHASATRAGTMAILVTAHDTEGNQGFGEGCPREYVTGESLDSAEAFFHLYRDVWCRGLPNVAALRDWTTAHREIIDRNPAAWCAVELALLDLYARRAGQSVEMLLGLAPLSEPFRYTAVIGDSGPEQTQAWFSRYWEMGFRDYKLKLSGDIARDREKLAVFRVENAHPLRLRADANNLWRDSHTAIAALQSLDYPFFAIEEPLARGDFDGMRAIADALGTRIILDESVTRRDDLAWISAGDERFIVNLRVSKMGGVLRSLELIGVARQKNIPLIIGAQVGETSLLTRAALGVAHAARDCLTAQEGAFGTLLLEHDLFVPTLMFGASGVLEPELFGLRNAIGWGLERVSPNTASAPE